VSSSMWPPAEDDAESVADVASKAWLAHTAGEDEGASGGRHGRCMPRSPRHHGCLCRHALLAQADVLS
jgi:hypothetical protein